MLASCISCGMYPFSQQRNRNSCRSHSNVGFLPFKAASRMPCFSGAFQLVRQLMALLSSSAVGTVYSSPLTERLGKDLP